MTIFSLLFKNRDICNALFDASSKRRERIRQNILANSNLERKQRPPNRHLHTPHTLRPLLRRTDGLTATDRQNKRQLALRAQQGHVHAARVGPLQHLAADREARRAHVRPPLSQPDAVRQSAEDRRARERIEDTGGANAHADHQFYGTAVAV